MGKSDGVGGFGWKICKNVYRGYYPPTCAGFEIANAVFQYIVEAYEEYEKQQRETPAPEYPTDPTGLPDYTEEIDEWMHKKEKEFLDIRNINCGQLMDITKEEMLILHFYNQVKTDGPMDIKNQEKWYDAFGFAQPSPAFFIYHGEIMDSGKLGNIAYGYVGAALYPDYMLYYGGGFANMKNINSKYIPALFVLPNYGDAPEDIEAIKQGIDMWKAEHISCTD